MQLPDLFNELRLSATCTKYKEISACPLYKINPSFLLHHTHFYFQTGFDFMDMGGQLPEAAHSKASLEEDTTCSQ